MTADDAIDAKLDDGSILNIACSEHAALRAAQRLGYDLGEARDLVRADVRAALTAGRWSRTPPKWLAGTAASHRRYVTRDATTVYVVELERRCWRIITCIVAPHGGPSMIAHYHFPRLWADRNDDRVHVFGNGHVFDKAERRRSVRQLIKMMRSERAERTC